MNFNSIIKTAGIPLVGGVYAGATRDESNTTFSGAFLRGGLLTAAGVTLSHAGNPAFAKALSEVGGKRGIAARAAYVPSFVAHETMTWVKQNALNPAMSMASKIRKGNLRGITGLEASGAAFTAYGAYEGAGILQSAGDADLGGVATGTALFAGGKYAYMAGIYGAKAMRHRNEISGAYKSYKKSSADEQDLMKMLLRKGTTTVSGRGIRTTEDFIMKGTIKSKQDIMMELGGAGVEVMNDPQYKKTVLAVHKKNGERVMKATKKMFGNTYHGAN